MSKPSSEQLQEVPVNAADMASKIHNEIFFKGFMQCLGVVGTIMENKFETINWNNTHDNIVGFFNELNNRLNKETNMTTRTTKKATTKKAVVAKKAVKKPAVKVAKKATKKVVAKKVATRKPASSRSTSARKA
jgi:hypothetical protein